MISITCLHCDQSLRAPERLQGQKTRCPYCKGINRVPFEIEPEPAPLPAVILQQAPPPAKSPGVAAILEVGPGLFQVFGLGHMYAGHILTGFLFLFGYWFAVLVVSVIGMLTCFGWLLIAPLWVITLVMSATIAAASCR